MKLEVKKISLVRLFLAVLLLAGCFAGCKRYEGQALSGEDVEKACESISYGVTEVEKGSVPDTRFYTIELANDSSYDLVGTYLTMVYQVLIEEKDVQYSGGEHYPKENPFVVPAGERKSFTLEIPVFDPSSMEGEQAVLKVTGYLDKERPENMILLSDTQILEE